MGIAGGRGQKAEADQGAAVKREPGAALGAARCAVLVDIAMQIAPGNTQVDILGSRPVVAGEEPAGSSAAS
jgi:hypothetical protein